MTPESISGPLSAAHRAEAAARNASQAAANSAANKPDDRDVQALAEDLRESAPSAVPPSLPGVGGHLDVYAGGVAKAEEKKDAHARPLGGPAERVLEAPELPYLRPLLEDKGRNFDAKL
jgi:hypothetical protein